MQWSIFHRVFGKNGQAVNYQSSLTCKTCLRFAQNLMYSVNAASLLVLLSEGMKVWIKRCSCDHPLYPSESMLHYRSHLLKCPGLRAWRAGVACMIHVITRLHHSMTAMPIRWTVGISSASEFEGRDGMSDLFPQYVSFRPLIRLIWLNQLSQLKYFILVRRKGSIRHERNIILGVSPYIWASA